MNIKEDIRNLRQLWAEAKSRPRLVLLVLVLCSLSFGLGGFVSGYFGELGRRLAERKEVQRDIKHEVSLLLQQINPQILAAARRGDPEMAIWINQIHIAQLKTLSAEPRFSDYLALQVLDVSATAQKGKKIDDDPMDLSGDGHVTRCLLTFGGGLRH